MGLTFTATSHGRLGTGGSERKGTYVLPTTQSVDHQNDQH